MKLAHLDEDEREENTFRYPSKNTTKRRFFMAVSCFGTIIMNYPTENDLYGGDWVLVDLDEEVDANA